ncbi:MAG: hypothetical protein ACTSVU_04550 [Promethearchaeota archaeon]
MKIGKLFAFLGGLFTFVGMFVFTLIYSDGSSYVTGINGFIKIPDMFGGVSFLMILAEIGIILYLISWLFQFLGIKFRFFSLLGSLLSLIVGIFVLLAVLGVSAGFIVDVKDFIISSMTNSNEIISGIIPLNIKLGADLTIGLLVILLGSFISFISVFMKRKD